MWVYFGWKCDGKVDGLCVFCVVEEYVLFTCDIMGCLVLKIVTKCEMKNISARGEESEAVPGRYEGCFNFYDV
jgi:hypothetical protein